MSDTLDTIAHDRWRFCDPEMQRLNAGLFVLEERARTERCMGDHRLVTAMQDYISDLFLLLDVFLKAPGRRVFGKDGVLEQLRDLRLSGELIDTRTSQNAWYHRLRELGLKASAFRRPQIRLSELLREGTVTNDAMGKVNERINTLSGNWKKELDRMLRIMA